MKKLSFLFFLLSTFFLFPKNIEASHIMGGQITWTCNGNGEYVFSFSTYKICFGANPGAGPPLGYLMLHNYPNPGDKRALAGPNGPLSYNDLANNPFSRVIAPNCTRDSSGIEVPVRCDRFEDNGVIEEYVRFADPIKLNGRPKTAAGWVITYHDVNRNALDNVDNIGGAPPGITLRAKIFDNGSFVADSCTDNSPIFREDAATLFTVGNTFTYNHNASDVELDSLVYDWAVSLRNFTGQFGGGRDSLINAYIEGVRPQEVTYSTGFDFDNPFPGVNTLDSITGQISIDPDTGDQGNYVSCIKVTAYKCGERAAEIYRELQSNILDTMGFGNNRPPLIRTANQKFRDTVKAGDFVSFDIQYIDFDFTDSVFITASGTQFGANFTDSLTGCDNPPCATIVGGIPSKSTFPGKTITINWQTDCNHVVANDNCVGLVNYYTFVFKAIDDGCPAPGTGLATYTIVVQQDSVIESPILNCVDVQSNGDVNLDWNTTVDPNNSFNAWMIYSATAENGPYTLVDSVKTYNTTTYTHVGADANNQRRWYFLRSRSGCKGSVLNVVRDTASTIFVDPQFTFDCIDVNWNPVADPNPAGSNLEYRLFREYPLGSGLNLYENPSTTSICDTFTVCTDSVYYQVELVNNVEGCNSTSNLVKYEFDNPKPDPDFSFSPDDPCPNNVVSFTNLTTIAGGTVTYTWDFGDGSISNATDPSHTYTTTGTYSVTLTAKSAFGCDTSITKDVVVDLPTADAGRDTSVCPGNSVVIGGVSTGRAPLTYTWSNTGTLTNFNNNQTPTASPTVTTTYTLTVTDAGGCENTDQITVSIATPPTADAGSNTTICFNDSATLGGSPTGPVDATYQWSNAGSLSNATVANPKASPNTTTTYTVTVTTGVNCTATDQVTVTVRPEIVADAGLDQSICATSSVQIGAIASGGTGTLNYKWDNTATLTADNIAQPFANPLVTTVYTVTVTDAANCTATDQVEVVVNDLPDVSFTYSDTCLGATTQFNGLPNGANSYRWDFGDGVGTSSQQNPTYSYVTSGSYDVKLVVENNSSCLDSITRTIEVKDLPIAEAGADATICNTDSAQIGAANNPLYDYDWGTEGTLSNDKISDPKAGPSTTRTYTVTVTERSTGCTATDQVTITVDPLPQVDFTFDEVCLNDQTEFTDATTIASGSFNNWEWDFGDGVGTSNQQNPTYQYAASGTYSVKLIVTSLEGCRDSISKDVEINPLPDVMFTYTDTCLGAPTRFTDGSTITSGSINDWSWDFGDGIGTSNQQNPSYTYAAAGIYNVKLVVGSGLTCRDSLTRTIEIKDLPIAEAGGPFAPICDRDTITIGSVDNPLYEYNWGISGTLSPSDTSSPRVYPSVTTTYTVTVTETSTGCTATDDVTITVNPVPEASFTYSDTCLGATTQFNGLPNGANSYRWDFGDGVGTSSQQNPTYSYVTSGSYDVKLVVENNSSCLDSITRTIEVKDLPIAEAGADATICNTDSAQIGAANNPLYDYDWGTEGTLSNDKISDPKAGPSTTRTYTVTVTERSTGCTATDQVTITVDPLPQVDFTFDEVCLNDQTEFTDATTIASGSFNNWEWDFGDGVGTSNQQNPTYQYAASGTYSVKLIVTSLEGCRDSISKDVEINPLPDVMFTYTDTCLGAPTRFTDGSTITSGSINDWSWDFGDGIGTSNQQNPSYTYAAAGIYNVKLVVGSGLTCRDSLTRTIEIKDLPIAEAGGPFAPICDRDTITIGSVDNPLYEYNWGISGTLSPSDTSSPRVYPSVTTTYTVTVTETSTGCTATDDVTITVNPVPEASFTYSDTCLGATTQFNGLPNGANSYRWDFGDGVGTSTQQNPTYSYATSGSYDVKLVVENNSSCLDSITRTIEVKDLPIAEAGADATICNTDSAQIGAANNPLYDYDWGTESTLSNDRISDPKAGPSITRTYTVTVTERSTGCTATDQVTITVDPLPQVDFTFDEVCLNDQTEFTDATTIASGSFNNWEWDFGDGVGTSSQQNPTYQYAASGTYSVKLIVTSLEGCRDSISKDVEINPLPDVMFTYADTCSGASTQFTDATTLSSGTFNNWEWDFGDGTGTSTDQNPSYTYGAIGIYSVKLVVTTALGCKDSLTRDIEIKDLPIAEAGVDATICNTDSAQIGTANNPLYDYDWGTESTLSNDKISDPKAAPSTTRTYMVTVTERSTGCTATDQVTITVDPLPQVDFTFDEVCLNNQTEFTDATTIASGSFNNWEWDFGDGVGTSSQQNPTYQYAASGTYSVKLIVTSLEGCRDSISKDVEINPLPDVMFTYTDTCLGAPTRFTDGSTISSGSINDWEWNFGDGLGTSTDQNPSYTYATSGTYSVKLVITTALGCKDSLTRDIEIKDLPIADAGSDVTICNRDTITIGSADNPLYEYDWGVSGTLSPSDISSPRVYPSVTTTYTVTVTETSTGCTATDEVTITVNPVPIASFTYSDTCAGTSTIFNGLPSGALSYRWDFGDGIGSSSQQNPSYQYGTSGFYDVKLVVENNSSCLDSITRTIEIKDAPIADAGPDTSVCIPDSVQIGSANNPLYSYAWGAGNLLSNDTISNPQVYSISFSPAGGASSFGVTVTERSTGCTATDDIFIVFHPLPEPDFTATKVCEGKETQFTTLSIDPNEIHEWDFGDGIGTSVQRNPVYTYTSAGTYAVKLTLTSDQGCRDSITRDVIVDTLPLANAGVDRTICENDTTILGKPAVVGESYQWDNASTLSNTVVAQPEAFPLVTTTYSVTITNTNGCTSIDEVEVTVNPAPNVDPGNEITICNTDTVILGGSPTSTTPLVTYKWDNASTLDDDESANPKAFPSDTTIYTVTITDQAGCSSVGSITVNVNPLPEPDYRVDAVCEGDFTAFTDLSTISVGAVEFYNWDFGDGVGSSPLQNPGYQYAAAGTYDVQLTLTSFEGCMDSIIKQVTINPTPLAEAGKDTAICIGDEIQLGGNPTGAVTSTFSWNPGTNLSSVTDPNPIASPLISTKYYLSVTDINGCYNRDSIVIDINPLPIILATSDKDTVCIEEDVQLDASGGDSYVWEPADWLSDPSIANPIAKPFKNVDYVVFGTDVNGCVNTDTVTIAVFNLDFVPSDTSVCFGDSVQLIPIIQGDEQGITYLWTPMDGLSSVTVREPMSSPLFDTEYVLEINNAFGCIDKDSIRITIDDTAGVSFEVQNSPRCSGSVLEVTNTSTMTTSYQWRLDGVIVSQEREPDLPIDNTKEHTLTLIGSNDNCTDSVTKIIPSASFVDLLDLKEVNVFTPNRDGINDIFSPGFQGEFIGCVEFRVYDRWGNKVFDSDIGQYGWDGRTLRGEEARNGVYYYVIRIATEEIKGSVYLNR